jgi:hypothetical protein
MVDHPARKPAWAPVLEPALPLALLWQFTLEADAICPARLAAAAQKVLYQPSPLTTSEASDAFAIGRSKTADKGITFSSDSHHPRGGRRNPLLSLAHEGGSLNVQAFDVTFHPDGSLTSYSEMLPGVSEDPASPHFGDQMRLASKVELRPDYFYLSDLEKNTESRTDIVVTGASPPVVKTR